MAAPAFLINNLVPNKNRLIAEIQTNFPEANNRLYCTDYACHMPELVREVIHTGAKTIVVVGGDGSLNEAVNGVINTFTFNGITDWKAVQAIQLGLLPAGSGNDFARMLYPNGFQLQTLQQSMNQNQSDLVNIGEAVFNSFSGEQTKRYFVNITDVGIGGDVVYNVKRRRKKLPRSVSYSFTILEQLLQFKKPKIEVKFDGGEWKGKSLGIVVALGKYFGKGLCIAPTAGLHNNHFSLVQLGNISLLDYLKNINKIKNCTKIVHPQVNYRNAKRVEISASKPVRIDMDGESIGTTPLNLQWMSKKIRLYNDAQ